MTGERVNMGQQPKPEQSDPDKALAKDWLKRIDDALTLRQDDEKRWRRNRLLLRGIEPDSAGGPGKRMRTNLHFANLAAMRPQVYAKDPEFAVTPTEAVPDERLATIRGFAKTAEQVVRELLIRRGHLKRKAKRILTSAYACSVGWWKLCWQEDRAVDPIIASQLKDAQDNLERLKRLQDEAGEAESGHDKEVAQLRETIAGLQAMPEVVKSRGLALDFIAPDDVLVLDASVREVTEYRRAEAMAHRVWMTRDQVKQRFPGYELKNARVYREAKGAEGQPQKQASGGDDKAKDLLAVWEVWEQVSGRVFTLCEGCEGYLRPPYSPTWTGKRWFPFFLLAFNEVDGGYFPLSDVDLIEEVVREYNRARDDFECDRKDSRPVNIARKGGSLTQDDIQAIRNRNGMDLILVEGPGGRPLSEDLFFGQLGKINPANYDTAPARQDMEMLVGGGDAARGSVLKAKTATEAEILAQGLRGRSAERTDIIEDMLSEAGAYALEVCLRKLSVEEVQQIAGPQAVWPDLSRPEEVFEQVNLQVRGGSTGKPDRLQEQDRWTKLLPVIEKAMAQVAQLRQQGMGAEAQAVVELVRETMRRFDERVDLERFLPVPKEGEEPGGQNVPPELVQRMQEMEAALQDAQQQLQDRSAELESKERQAAMAADAKVQAAVGAAEVKARGEVEQAAIAADTAVMHAATQPALPMHSAFGMDPGMQPAAMPAPPKQPAAQRAPKQAAGPDALSLLVPVLVQMQSQLSALAMAVQQPQQSRQPMEVVHERDPATGRIVRSVQRPVQA